MNLLSGKTYIGKSHNYEARIKNHLNKAFKYNSMAAIHCALRKYGADAFMFCVVEEWSDRNTLGSREKYWIELLNTKAPYGYNLTDGGEGSFGKVASPETKAKQSASMRDFALRNSKVYSDRSKAMWRTKGYRDKLLPIISAMGKLRSKEVCQYNLDGSLISTYTSQTEAAIQTGISSKQINSAVKGRQKTAGGFVWKDNV